MTDLLSRLDVSRETEERLDALEAALRKWNPAINLVAKSTLDNARQRHIIDSVQLFPQLPFRHWADLGSGGGFPGVVIAILAAEKMPTAKVTLVESDQRKATFLRSVLRDVGVSASVLSERIEELDPLDADMLSARALAPLATLCGFAARHLAENGTSIFPKGASWQAEVAAARESWKFDLSVRSSEIEPGSVVLELKAIAHV